MDYMRNFENIQKLLLSTKDSAIKDQTTFRMWEEGVISTPRCLKAFKQHNRQIDVEIPLEEFEDWLMSLGYRRDE